MKALYIILLILAVSCSVAETHKTAEEAETSITEKNAVTVKHTSRTEYEGGEIIATENVTETVDESTGIVTYKHAATEDQTESDEAIDKSLTYFLFFGVVLLLLFGAVIAVRYWFKKVVVSWFIK